jgi:hypothetical protein
MGSDSGSGTDDEREKATKDVEVGSKPQRKKSSTKRSLDMQRKISLSKLKEEKKENTQNSPTSLDSTESSPSPHINLQSIPPRHRNSRFGSMKNGKSVGGYDQYLKQYLLQVPMPSDYGEPSSDDLSSEWDSDVPDNKNSEVNKESKVRQMTLSLIISFYIVVIKNIAILSSRVIHTHSFGLK